MVEFCIILGDINNKEDFKSLQEFMCVQFRYKNIRIISNKNYHGVFLSHLENDPIININEFIIRIKLRNSFPTEKRNVNNNIFSNIEEICFNRITEELEIKTSTFGLTQIYCYFSKDKRLILSSNIKNILHLYEEEKAELNYDSIIEYLYSHIIYGQKTLFSNIYLLNSNSKFMFNLSNISYELFIRSLNTSEKIIKHLEYDTNVCYERICKEISEKFKNSVNYPCLFSNRILLPLSGGLDSRLIASALSNENRKKTVALTFDFLENGKEITRARKVANYYGIKHVFSKVKEEHILGNINSVIWKTEGQGYNYLGIILELWKKIDGDIILDGYAGDAQLGGEFLGWKDKSKENIYERTIKLLEEKKYAFPRKLFFRLFNKSEQKKLENILLDGIKDLYNSFWFSSDKYLIMESFLYFSRVRRNTIGGARLSEHYGVNVKPFYDIEVMSRVLQIPNKYRKNRKLEKKIQFILDPEITSDSTSTSVFFRIYFFLKSVPLFKKMIKYLFNVKNSIENIFGIQFLPKYSNLLHNILRKGKGYDTYINWITSEILNESNLIFSIVDYKQVYQMFQKNIRGRENYFTYLVNLIDLELFFQLLYSSTSYLKKECKKIILKSKKSLTFKEIKNPYLQF